ncbi:MAG: DUF368 domain-containing protein [Clostridium sp.]|nr:DUF368 domain-containing protein [Clostridium sp.]MCM1443892.1 DUF368 domain-containing protein [Candidatus Amulumruptor caecigallinarius]
MKEWIINVLKGLIIGIGKIIPGVSGAVLAISLGVYEKSLNAISKLTKENIRFLLNICIGIILSIIVFSKAINYSLSNFYLPTMLLFIGLIMGGIGDIKKNIGELNGKKILIFIITFTLLFLVCLITGERNIELNLNITTYIALVFAGIIDAFATIVPGISGTALLMIYGYYNIIINSIANVFNASMFVNNIFILSAYGIGMIIGILIFSKIINYYFKRKKVYMYSSIFGFVTATIVILFLKTFIYSRQINNIFTILISLVLLVIGYFLAKKISK